ncbi:DUF6804 family protein [Ciceribacter azotifigens]|uniref:DUF6804 family protein n=1 Tax=Ciceribacter azotifigens TaxID=2069303 RepID=UPI003A8718AF
MSGLLGATPVLLAVATMPMPYGYYTLLRLVVTVAGVFLAWSEFQTHQRLTVWVLLFGFLALLFNPVIPVHLDREVWFVLDLGAAAIFIARWLVGLRSGRN